MRRIDYRLLRVCTLIQVHNIQGVLGDDKIPEIDAVTCATVTPMYSSST